MVEIKFKANANNPRDIETFRYNNEDVTCRVLKFSIVVVAGESFACTFKLVEVDEKGRVLYTTNKRVKTKNRMCPCVIL